MESKIEYFNNLGKLKDNIINKINNKLIICKIIKYKNYKNKKSKKINTKLYYFSNHRKNEKYRKGKGYFCEVYIEEAFNAQTNKHEYKLVAAHYIEYVSLLKRKDIVKSKIEIEKK